MHKALTYVNIPPDNRKVPGDTITDEEWAAADPPQTKAAIKELVDSGAITTDMDADILDIHKPVDPNAPTQARMIEEAKVLREQLGDDTPPEIVALAETVLVSDGDAAVGGDASAS